MKKLLVLFLSLYSVLCFAFKTETLEKDTMQNIRFTQSIIIYPEENKFPDKNELQVIAYKIKKENPNFKNYYIAFLLPDMVPGWEAYATANSENGNNPSMKAKIIYYDLISNKYYKQYVKTDENGNSFLSDYIPEDYSVPSFETGIDLKVVKKENLGYIKYTLFTNLPENTKINISLENQNYKKTITSQVHNNIAEGQYFSTETGDMIPKGEYTLNICTMLPFAQPKEVLNIIGNDGELMTGKYIVDDIDPIFNKKIKSLKYTEKVIIK